MKYWIRLVHPGYFSGDLPYCCDVHDGTDGLYNLMNFRDSAKAQAERICKNDKAIVYVTRGKNGQVLTEKEEMWAQKFVRAIEYLGTVKDGTIAARAWGEKIEWLPKGWRKVFLPIRILAKTDPPANTVHFQTILEKAGVTFDPKPGPMVEISREEYDRLYDAIDWQWEAHSRR